ncbi:hypothetical protein Tco_0733266 [Tanacetum coccineum]
MTTRSFLPMLITKICPLLATRTTVDDDEIAPRRNAILSFKVPDKNMLTTRTMDDEDAPGLKAVLTFHVLPSMFLMELHMKMSTFDDRIAQSESSTQTCLEHAQEDDQVEKKAMT